MPATRTSLPDLLLTALAPLIWGSTYLVTTLFLPPERPFTAALLRVLPAGGCCWRRIGRCPRGAIGAGLRCWAC